MARRHPARSEAGPDTPQIGTLHEQAMPPTMDDLQPAEDDERAADALDALRHALDAADPDNRAFVLDLIDGLARHLGDRDPV